MQVLEEKQTALLFETTIVLILSKPVSACSSSWRVLA
jgi:hypothetical protein